MEPLITCIIISFSLRAAFGQPSGSLRGKWDLSPSILPLKFWTFVIFSRNRDFMCCCNGKFIYLQTKELFLAFLAWSF